MQYLFCRLDLLIKFITQSIYRYIGLYRIFILKHLLQARFGKENLLQAQALRWCCFTDNTAVSDL